MFAQIRRLFKDFSFLLKVLQLLLACICLRELSKYSEYMIPKWLWVIYCIDSLTYAIVYFSIAMTHVFEKPRKLAEFTYFSLGVIFNFIGGVAGIERGRHDYSAVSENRSELKIGLLLIANFIVLFLETAYMIHFEYKSKQKSNPVRANISTTNT